MSWRTRSSLAWLRGLRGVQEDEPLASRTSFGIGGPAEFFVALSRADALEKVLDGCKERDIPYFLLRAGANLLIAHGGGEGRVVRVTRREHEIEGGRGRGAARLERIPP